MALVPTQHGQDTEQKSTQQKSKATLVLLLGVLLPLLLAALLTDSVLRRGGFAWDQGILAWYGSHRTPFWTNLAEWLAVVGGLGVLPWVTLALCGGLLLRHKRSGALFLALSVYGAILLNVTAKVVFQRPRPDELGAVVSEPGYSFPSGHTMSNVAFGLALAFLFRNSRYRGLAAVLGVGWGVVVAMSRNYLGVHYPTDVTVGFLASLAWVSGLAVIFRRSTL